MASQSIAIIFFYRPFWRSLYCIMCTFTGPNSVSQYLEAILHPKSCTEAIILLLPVEILLQMTMEEEQNIHARTVRTIFKLGAMHKQSHHDYYHCYYDGANLFDCP
jgi:hypothetical protein